MDVTEGKTSIICGLYKQSGHNCRPCQNRNKVNKTMWRMYVIFIDTMM